MTFIIGVLIGSGAIGSVYHARWGTRKVAIKKLAVGWAEMQQDAQIQQEMAMLRQLHDRHVIQLYGSTYHEDKLVLVMDYAEGGNLQTAIQKRVLLDWAVKARLAQEIAQGLAYLHHERILHRDLKSANVLLTRHMEVKLCDFGMGAIKEACRFKSSISRTNIYSTNNNSNSNGHGGESGSSSEAHLMGTFRWMAPELFTACPKYSTKSDMYALAMVMWEMAADCTVPFRDQPDYWTVVALVKAGEREVLPPDTPPDYRRWAEQCWDQDPLKRPMAADMLTAEDEDALQEGEEEGEEQLQQQQQQQ